VSISSSAKSSDDDGRGFRTSWLVDFEEDDEEETAVVLIESGSPVVDAVESGAPGVDCDCDCARWMLSSLSSRNCDSSSSGPSVEEDLLEGESKHETAGSMFSPSHIQWSCTSVMCEPLAIVCQWAPTFMTMRYSVASGVSGSSVASINEPSSTGRVAADG